MFKCSLLSLPMDRVPGTFYVKAPDCAPGKELYFLCSDNLQLFPISNVQILPFLKFSQVHQLSGKTTKYKETGTLAGKGMKVKAMFERFLPFLY